MDLWHNNKVVCCAKTLSVGWPLWWLIQVIQQETSNMNMRLRVLIGCSMAMILTAGSVHAAGKFFSFGTGTNTWDTVSNFWGTVSGGPYDTNWANNDDAVFEGTPGTVNLSSTQTADSVTFATNGYTIAGGTLMLASTAGVTNDANATIGSIVAGTSGLMKAGNGTLTLTASNVYSGGTTVNGGVLNIGGGGATGSIPANSLSVASGATLVYNFSSALTPTPLSVTGNLQYLSGGIVSMSGTFGGDQIIATSSGSYVNFTGNMVINAGAGGASITGSTGWGIYSAGSRNITTTGNVTFKGIGSNGGFDGGINAAGVYTATTGTLTFDGTAAASGGYGIECGDSGAWAGAISTFGNVILKGTGGTTRNSDLNVGPLTGNGTVTLIGRLKGLNSYSTFVASGGLPYNVVIQTTAGGINGLFAGGADNTGNGNYTVNAVGAVVFGGRTVNVGTGTISLTSGTGYSITANSTLQGGSLVLGDTRNIAISSGATFTLNTTGTVSNAISGAGNFAVSGGSVTLEGTNVYSGATTVNGGVLILASGAAIADAGAVTLGNVAGATLQLNASETIGSLGGGGGSGGSVNLPAFDLTTGGNNSNTVFNGVISGTGNVVKAGAGTQTLGGTNTATGTLIVNAGAISLGFGGQWGGPVQVNAGAVLTGSGSILGGGTTVSDGGALRPGSTTSGGLVSCSDLTLGNGTNTFNLFDTTLGGVSNSLVAVTNTFVVNNSVIAINPWRLLPNGLYPLFLCTNPPTGSGFNATVLGNLTRNAWTLTNTANAVCLNISGSAASLRWDPTVNGNWDLDSTSNWVDGVTKSFYYNGDTVTFDDGGAAINPTVLLFGALNPLSLTVSNAIDYVFTGNGMLSGVGPLLKAGVGTLTFTDTPNVACPIVISNGAVAFNTATTNETYSKALSGAPGKIIKTGSGTLTLTGANTYAGGTTVNAGVLNVGAGGTTGSILTNSLTVASGATLTYNLSPAFTAVPLTVTGSVNYISGDVLSMSGTYGAYQITATSPGPYLNIAGNLVINAGAGGATLSGLSNYGIYSGGQRNISTTGNVTFVGINTRNYYDCGINAAGVYTATSGTLIFDGSTGGTGGFGIEAGFSGGWGGSISTFGNVVFKGTGGNYSGHNGDLGLGNLTGNGTVTLIGRLKGLISNSAFTSTGGLPYNVIIQTTAGDINGLLGVGTDTTSNGNYTVQSAGAVVFSGRTVNAGTGTVNLTSATGYTVTANSTLRGGSLAINDNRGISISSNVTFTLSATAAISNVVSGLGNFAVTGGAITLTGIDIYSGTTTVSGGSLYIDKTLTGTGIVTVTSGGTLGGTGMVAGVTMISSGGVLSPGDPSVNNGVGRMTVSNTVTLASNATYAVQVLTNGVADLLVSSATVTNLGATLSVSALDSTIREGTKFTVITASNLVGTFDGLPDGAIFKSGGHRYIVTYPDNTKVVVQLAASGTQILVQ